jgi:hypothetical protein
VCRSLVENNKLKEEIDDLILLLERCVQYLICLFSAKDFLFEYELKLSGYFSVWLRIE